MYKFVHIYSCPKTTNIRPLTKRQPHSLDAYHSTITSSTKMLPGQVSSPTGLISWICMS